MTHQKELMAEKSTKETKISLENRFKKSLDFILKKWN